MDITKESTVTLVLNNEESLVLAALIMSGMNIGELNNTALASIIFELDYTLPNSTIKSIMKDFYQIALHEIN